MPEAWTVAGAGQRSGHAGSSQNSDNKFSIRFNQHHPTLKTMSISFIASRNTKWFNWGSLFIQRYFPGQSEGTVTQQFSLLWSALLLTPLSPPIRAPALSRATSGGSEVLGRCGEACAGYGSAWMGGHPHRPHEWLVGHTSDHLLMAHRIWGVREPWLLGPIHRTSALLPAPTKPGPCKPSLQHWHKVQIS